MSWDTELEERLRREYGSSDTENARSQPSPTASPAGDGFLAEVAGKLILAAPAGKVSVADELPADMRERWEKASAANPYFTWIQGRFVEAERANGNGAFWSAGDLAHGEMSVRHGPLNWLHDARTVIGCIADNKLIAPQAPTVVQSASSTASSLTYTAVTNTANIDTRPTPVTTATVQRPYIAATAAIWKWVHPEQARAVEAASDAGRLWFSMECVAREMACHTDGDRVGCGRSFPYMQAMTRPDTVCEHIRARTCARRMIDPAFLGGAVVVPPAQPGWRGADAEVIRQAAALAEQVAPADAKAAEWESLMASVLAYAHGETR